MSINSIKFVIFDFDGTLADSGRIAFNAINRVSQKHGFTELDWSEVDKLRAMSSKERSKHMGVSKLRTPFLAPEFYKFYKEEMKEMKLNPGIPELLEKLHDSGYGLVVISSNAENNIREFLRRKNIFVFSDVICSRHVFSKDRMIRKFLKKKNLLPEDVIYIGDETRDIKACKETGVRIIWVDWGLDKKEAAVLGEPDYMVSDANEIYNIMQSLEK